MRKIIPFIIVATLFTSCATLFRKDTKQPVTFKTEPSGAEVFVDGKAVGNSPVVYALETKESHTIKYKKDGFPDRTFKVEPEIAARYVAGDILMGGVAFGWIPLIVDYKKNKWNEFNQWEIDSKGNLGKKLPVLDRDGDGVPDDMDDCPNTKGKAEFNGCPDSDGDGIQDNKDECPSTAGIEKFNGCPDTDGDGVADKDDKCPKVAGKINGCPDTDGDGIIDSKDKCPKKAGTMANKGCPEITKKEKEVLSKAMKGIFFKSGSDVIKDNSFPILDEVATVMKNNPKAKLDINGHTDNTGNYEYNVDLSKKRAASVREYLIKKGVESSRMTSNGYGPDKPIDTNDTATGRANNRRVEFTVNY